MTEKDYNAMVEYENELSDMYEEAFYYDTINSCAWLIERYGMPTVMKDIIKKLTANEQIKYSQSASTL